MIRYRIWMLKHMLLCGFIDTQRKTKYIQVYPSRFPNSATSFSQSLTISLLLFRCLASHPRPFRVEVTLSWRLMVSQCHCHSHPSPSTLTPLASQPPLLLYPSVRNVAHNMPAITRPSALSLLCTHKVSLQCKHMHRRLTMSNLPKDRFHQVGKFNKICGALYECLSGQMEK